MRLRHASIGVLFVMLAGHAFAADLSKPLEALRSVGPKGQGHAAAISAWKEVAAADVEQLPTVLKAMDGVSALPSNWIRSAVEAIADRQLKSGGSLPETALEAFVRDTKRSPRGRRLAFELLSRVDPAAKNRIIPGLTQDPALELRRDAIGMAVNRAEALAEQDAKPEAIKAYQAAFVDSRDIDQIKDIASRLEGLGAKPDLPTHFGFVMEWHLLAPFDNRNKSGFDVAYPPENEIDLTAEYPGLKGKVKWIQHATNDPFGTVDINKAIGKHMGAVCYAYTEFESAQNRDCEIRVGCINANKVWLNGKLLTANQVYHAGTDIDQYSASARLKKGKNHILVKVCQNEQTEAWAQRWQFQLRVCDELGTAILSAGRKTPKAAHRDVPRTIVLAR